MPGPEQEHHPEQRRAPLVTVACLGAALMLLLVMALVPLPSPYVSGGLRLGGLLLCIPPALGLLGAVGAVLDRRLERGRRRGWAIASALAGFVGVWALLVIVTFVSGP